MRVSVLGAGVIGTACAYYLAKAGHEVTVVDRQPGPGLETSFANAGGVCPGFAGPWAAPGMPGNILRWLLMSDAPLTVRPKLDIKQWRWLLAFASNCSAERFARNKACMQRLAHHSKACLVALRDETGIAYDHGTGGVLQVFRTEGECELGERSARVLSSFGVPHRLVNAVEAEAIEPALAVASVGLLGGLYLPDDETGDCHRFTKRLAELLRARGVDFRFNTRVERLLLDGDRLGGALTSRGVLEADAFVVALASEGPSLLGPCGIDLPIYPVKGYSLTAQLRDDAPGPRSSVMDEHSKIMVTRLGDTIRAAGGAEITGFERNVDPRKSRSLRRKVEELFPQAADYARAEYWAGLRPMTPDGPPYLGPTPIANLFLDIGHGSNGWTQACGSGQIVADLVSGRQPDISLEGAEFGRA